MDACGCVVVDQAFVYKTYQPGPSWAAVFLDQKGLWLVFGSFGSTKWNRQEKDAFLMAAVDPVASRLTNWVSTVWKQVPAEWWDPMTPQGQPCQPNIMSILTMTPLLVDAKVSDNNSVQVVYEGVEVLWSHRGEDSVDMGLLGTVLGQSVVMQSFDTESMARLLTIMCKERRYGSGLGILDDVEDQSYAVALLGGIMESMTECLPAAWWDPKTPQGEPCQPNIMSILTMWALLVDAKVSDDNSVEVVYEGVEVLWSHRGEDSVDMRQLGAVLGQSVVMQSFDTESMATLLTMLCKERRRCSGLGILDDVEDQSYAVALLGGIMESMTGWSSTDWGMVLRKSFVYKTYQPGPSWAAVFLDQKGLWLVFGSFGSTKWNRQEKDAFLMAAVDPVASRLTNWVSTVWKQVPAEWWDPMTPQGQPCQPNIMSILTMTPLLVDAKVSDNNSVQVVYEGVEVLWSHRGEDSVDMGLLGTVLGQSVVMQSFDTESMARLLTIMCKERRYGSGLGILDDVEDQSYAVALLGGIMESMTECLPAAWWDPKTPQGEPCQPNIMSILTMWALLVDAKVSDDNSVEVVYEGVEVLWSHRGEDSVDMRQLGAVLGQSVVMQSFDTESMATLLTMLCKERRRCSGLGILDDVEDQSYAVALLGGIMENMTGWSSTDWGMVLRKSFVYKTYQPGPSWAAVFLDQKGLWLVFGSFGSTKWNRQEKDAFLMAAVDPVASRLTNWVSTVWKQVPAEWWDPMTPQGQPCQPNIMSILTMTPLLVDAKVSDNNSVQVVYEGVEVLWSHRGEDSVDMGLLGTVLGQSVVMQSFDTESMARLLTIMCKERRYGSGLGILDDVEDQSYAVALLGGIMESMTECLPAAWWDPKTPQGEPCQPNIMSILTMWALLVDAKVSDDNSVEVVYEGVEVLWSHRGEDSVDMRQLGAVLGQSVVMQSFDTESMATLLTMLCKERRRCSGLGILDDVEDQSYAVALLGGIMESMTGWSSTDWGMVLRKSFVYKTYQPGPSWAAVFLDQKGLWLVFGSFGSTKWNRQEKDAFLMAAVDPVASRLTNWVSTVWKQVPAEWWDPMTPQGQPCQPNIMSILTMTPLLVDAKVSDNNSVQVVYEGVEVLWSHRGEDSVDMGLLGTVLGQSVVMQSFDTESMARLLTIMCKERRYGSGLGILDDVEDQSYAVALLGGIMESMTECLPAAWWDPKTPQGEPCQPNIMSILTMWALLVDAKVSDDNSVEVVYEGVEVLWSHRGEDSVDMRQLGAVLGQSVVMQSFDTESMATLLTMLCKERRRCSGLGILDDVEDQSYAVALLGGIMESMTGWSSTDWGMVLRKSFVYKTYQPGPSWAAVFLDQKGLWLVFGSFGSTKWNRQEKDAFLMAAVDPVASRLTNWVSTVWKQVPAEWWDPMTPQGQPCQPNIMSILTMTPLLVDAKVSDNNSVQVVYEGVEVLWSHRGEDSVDMGLLGTVLGQSVVMQSFDTESMARLLTIMCKERRYGSGLGILDDVEDQSYAVALLGGIMESMTECLPAAWWDPKTPQGEPCQPNIMSILTMWALLVDAKVSDDNSVEVVYEGVEVLWSHRGEDSVDMRQLGAVLGQSVVMQSFDTESMATLLTMLCKERRRCSGLGILDDVEDQSYAVALLGGIMESMTGWSSTDWGMVLR